MSSFNGGIDTGNEGIAARHADDGRVVADADGARTPALQQDAYRVELRSRS